MRLTITLVSGRAKVLGRKLMRCRVDQLSGAVGRLRMLALVSGQEVDKSMQQVQRLSERVDRTDTIIVRTTAQMARIK